MLDELLRGRPIHEHFVALHKFLRGFWEPHKVYILFASACADRTQCYTKLRSQLQTNWTLSSPTCGHATFDHRHVPHLYLRQIVGQKEALQSNDRRFRDLHRNCMDVSPHSSAQPKPQIIACNEDLVCTKVEVKAPAVFDGHCLNAKLLSQI